MKMRGSAVFSVSYTLSGVSHMGLFLMQSGLLFPRKKQDTAILEVAVSCLCVCRSDEKSLFICRTCDPIRPNSIFEYCVAQAMKNPFLKILVGPCTRAFFQSAP
jgi:hypothetical protein